MTKSYLKPSARRRSRRERRWTLNRHRSYIREAERGLGRVCDWIYRFCLKTLRVYREPLDTGAGGGL